MEQFKIDQDMTSQMSIPKQRAGFVSFYLWLALVVNSIIGLAYFATIFTRKGLWSAYDPMWTRIYGFVSSAILVYGYVLLLRWRRPGFFVLALMAGVNLVMNLSTGGDLSLITFSPLFGILILYAVLQIRKNGKSCWKELTF